MKTLVSALLSTAIAIVLVGTSACSTTQAKGDVLASSGQAPNPFPFDDRPADLPLAGPLYFETDTDTLSDESRAMLQRIAAYMDRRTDAAVVVTGHCDERGDAAYNLALGERRAQAARAYLASLGVDPARVRAVSLGEETPVVDGTGEPAWSWNRRDEFQFVSAGQLASAAVY